MAEIDPNFSFPMAVPPPSNSIPVGLGSPARPRPKSAGGYMLSPGLLEPDSAAPRRRTHMHRRSAAMSEDLSTADLSAITGVPPMPAFGTSAPTPSVLSQYMRSSESPSKSPYPPSPAMNPLWQNPLASDSNSSLNLNRTQSTQSGNRVMFVEPASPHRSPWRRQQVTPLVPLNATAPTLVTPASQPHPLTPPNDVNSIRSSPSPVHSQASSKKDERKHGRRKSLARLFKWSKDKSIPNLQPPEPQAEKKQELPQSAYVTPPMPLPPKFSSPGLSPSDLYDTIEPQPPSIDLDEALSCSFSHRRSESLPTGLDSPFSKTTSGSYIGPVLEEEDEDQDTSSDEERLPKSLQRSKSVNSHTRTHARPESFVSTTRSVNPQSPVSNLGIASPSRSSLSSRVSLDSVDRPRGHVRRRSLIDRMLGRPVSMPPPAASGQ